MVSIIIPAWNLLNLLKQTLESLIKYTGGDYEVIVVDNGSTDGSAEYLKGLSDKNPHFKIIYNKENAGFIKAANQGILLARGEYICLLNNDVIVTHNWLLKLTRCMESDPDIGLVGPYSNYVAGRQRYPAQYKNNEQFEEFAMRFSQKEQDVDFLVGFCLLVKQEVFSKCGLFDEDFGIGNFEDNFLCWKAKQSGYRLKIANCYVHHEGSQSFRKDPKAYNELLARNQKIFYKKTDREIKISLCLAVADSEKPGTLKKCLDSIGLYCDEICINFNYKHWWNKVNIIKKFQGILPFNNFNKFPSLYNPEIPNIAHKDYILRWSYQKWHNDFSKAKNRAIDMAMGDWLFLLDCSDTFINGITLREAVVANDSIGDAIFLNVFAMGEDGVDTHLRHARIIRNNKNYRFRKSIHEDLVLSLKEQKARIIHSDLVIRHHGYEEKGAALKKNERNLKIMKQYFKINKYPDSLDYFHLANAYILLGNKESKEEAIRTIDKCLAIPLPEIDDLWPKMIFLKARIHHDIGRLDEAKKWYQLSIDKRNYIESYLGIAEVLVTQEKIEPALEYLEKMLAIGDKDGFEITSVPKNLKEMEIEMYYNLGYCYFMKENFVKAKEYFGRCLTVAPYHLKAIDFACDILRKEGKHGEAFNITLNAIEKFPGLALFWNNAAGFQILQKHYVMARLFIAQALRLNPKYEDALKNLKLIEEGSGK